MAAIASSYDGGVVVGDASYGSCLTNECHNDGTGNAPAPAYTWGNSYANCTLCHDYPIGTLAHDDHLGAGATYGVAIDCATCHGVDAQQQASHIDSGVTLVGEAAGYSGNKTVGDGGVFGSCDTNACHNDGSAGRLAPVRSSVWDTTTFVEDCASCHQGALMATNGHGVHLTSNALPDGDDLTECVTCHATTATASKTAAAGSHFVSGQDVSFVSTYDYEAGTASRANTGGSTTCSAVICHNGVTTPAWSSGISCGECHQDTAASSALPSWETSVEGSHTAHADTDAVYTECNDCHTGASSYTANGGTNHQNLVVNITPDTGTYLDADGAAGVNWSGDGVDDGTCSTVSCHGASTPVWGGTVTCGSCHDNGMPPVSGAHSSHFANSNTDYTECVVCHGDNGDNYQSGLDPHINGTVDVLGTGVTWNNSGTAGTPDDDTCTTTVCHSASNTAVWGDTTAAWGGGSSIGCDECHYWASPPTAAGNGAVAGTISELSHDGHFAATGRTFECVDCHASVTDSGHISASAGSDGAVLVDRANAQQDEATIDTTGAWIAAGDWDGSDTCTNACHDPSGTAYAGSGVWGNSNTGCTMCHSDTDPGTGSHGAHMAAAGTYGITVDCVNCHVDNTGSDGHMTGAVDLTAVGGTYSGNLPSPYGTPFGTCQTSTCHNDGTGTAVVTSTWGTSIAGPNCGICHDSAPSTMSHNAHFNAAATWGVSPDCDSCHASDGQDLSMGAYSSHIDSNVTMSSAATSYDGGVVVGDASYGSCLTNVCHNAGTTALSPPARSYTWGVALADDCASCHEGALMATNGHGVHLTSNALPAADDLTECVTCHATTATVSKTAAAGSHFASGQDVSFVSSFGYEGGTASRSGTGGSTTCSAVICHNGVTTPVWSGSVNCGDCHNTAGSSALPGWESSVSRSHLAHANTDSDYTECDNCHTGASSYTANGGTNHQDLNVDIAPSGGAYSDTDGAAGVNWAATDYLDDGTCDNTACHGSPSTLPQWGESGTVTCGSCHDNGMPPVSGAHSVHLSAIAGSATATGTNSDYTECVVCHGDNGDTYQTDLGTHINGNVDVLGTNVSWSDNATAGTPDDDTCTTSVCHSASTPVSWGDSGVTWDTTAVGANFDCGECHYWDTSGNASQADNNLDANSLSSDHGTHFDAGYYCTDCHGALPADNAHITSPAATNDGAVLVGRANADRNLDTVEVTVPTWNDGTDSCSNGLCHNPSGYGGASYAATWQVSAAACDLCHAPLAGDPGTGSHGAHLAAAGTYGITVSCSNCHGADPSATDHRNSQVDFALADTGYGGSAAAPYGTPFGSCTTSTCHNDGTGSAVATSTWGTSIADPNCGICHDQAPVSGNHTDHLSAAYGPGFGTNCGSCHASNGNNTTMAGYTSHINGSVQFANVDTTTADFATLGATAISTDPDATDTDRCTSCHSWATVSSGIGAELAKANWDSSGYELDCLTCHNSTDPSTQNADGSGAAAPAKEVSWTAGHGLDSASTYTLSGNTGAQTACADCHDKTSAHISGALGQDRLVTAGNALCTNCHDGTVDGAGGKSALAVATHSNMGATFDAGAYKNEADMQLNCIECHDAHGTTNIYMVNTVDTDSPLTAPRWYDGSSDLVQKLFGGTVSFTDNTTGAGYANSGAGDTSKVCQTCHTATGFYDDANGASGHYTGKCVGCHSHYPAYDDPAQDGFMPVQCNACHSYPGLATADSDHTLSSAHAIHAGASSSGGPVNYDFPCAACHYNYSHNDTVYDDNDGWPASTAAANVDVRFDPAYNPANVNGPSYAGVGATVGSGASGNGGTGSCAGLNCHGNDAANQSDWAGSEETPTWDSAAKTCGSCHTDPPASGAHELHTNVGGDTGRDDCVICHASADNYSAIAGTHINGTPGVADVTGVGYAGQTGASDDGYCASACHDSGAGDDQWNDGQLDCDACHYYEAAPSDTANTNHLATISELSHNGHLDTGNGRSFGCADCHIVLTGDGNGATAGSTLSHISDRTGATDAARITDMAAAVQDEATIDTTGMWITGGDWNDGTDTCANACHDPSVSGSYSAAWGNTNSSCTFCHSMADPGTGSHGAHMAAAGTYGITVGCDSCHPDNGTNYGHMDEAVTFALAGTGYGGNASAPYGTPFGSCTTTDCHNDGTGSAVATSTWGTSIADPNCGICHASAPPTLSHNAHLSPAATYGLSADCDDCHASGGQDQSMGAFASHIDSTVTMAAGAASYDGGVSVGDTNYGSCLTNVCHSDGAGSPPARSYTWGIALADDCASCHEGSGMATFAHDPHLASNALAGTNLIECVACHSATATASGAASAGSHLDASVNLVFETSYGYEGVAPDRAAGAGSTTTCSAVVCHNGVTTPEWRGAVACGTCHRDTAGSSPLPSWSGSVTGSHTAHADTDAVYTDCDKCHGVVAGVYTAVGGTNHQNLVVELASLPGASAAYSDADPAGVNWVSGDGVDDGTCSDVTCHGVSTPVWGGSVTCGECHADGQLPPTTGAHTPHFVSAAGISGSDTDYTECVACHGNYTATHADGTVDVNGSGVAYSAATNNCNTSVCHSPVNGTLATSSAWTSTETLDCNECHYWEALPASSVANAGNSNQVSGLSHNGHFDAARNFVCADCHGTVSDLTHISSIAGSDGAVLVDRANAIQDEAFIDETGSWFATGAFNDTTNTCTNVCHDPSVNGSYQAAWGDTNSSCTYCHSMSDPGTGSHSSHLAVGVYGGSIDCASCHPDNGTAYDHMDGAVALSLTALTYGGDLNAPYATTFGNCSTTTCHNNGQGAAVATTVWGNNNPSDDCGICHQASPGTDAHSKHNAHPTVDCTDCHAATSESSMSGQTNHLDNTVNLASRAASYDGGVAVGDTSYGSCDSGACHDAAIDIAWDASPTNCTDCHYNDNDVNSFDGQDKTASVVASGQWSSYGHSAQGIACLDCHALSAAHDFSAALDSTSNPFRLGTTGAPYAGTPDVFCSNTAAGCHNASPAADVMSHTDENMTAAKRSWPSWDPKCVDCHDPHGDGANLSMIQSDLFDAGSTTTGVPLASDADLVVFTTRDGIGSGSYANTPAADGICQECHTATASFVDGSATATTEAHPGAGLSPCTNCHKHDSAFEPSGCDSCHGDQAGSYWPAGSTYPNTGGRHSAHISALQSEAGLGTSDADQRTMCQYCHNDPTSPPAGNGGHYETPSWVAPANVGSFNRIWDSAADSAGTAATYDTVGDTCAGIDCHNNVTTAANFSWYAASTTACAMCHDDVTATATSTGITHTNHTGASGSFGLTVTCDTCHFATTWDSAAPGTGHRNGSWTFEFDYSVGNWAGVAYSGSWEDVTAGSCGTNTCHNDGRGAAAAAYTWGTAYDDCNTCHVDEPLTSSHGQHLASTVTFGLTIGCADCHGTDAQQQASHIDSQVTLASNASSYDGGVAVGDSNFGSCLTNFCHNDGTGGAPAIPGYTWSQSLDDCNTCHSDSPASGNHVTHLATPYGPSATCGECHAANNNNTTMAGQASHISGTVDFASATTIGTTAACETCHGGSTAAATAKSYWARTTGQWLSDGSYCESCHGDNQAAVIDTVTAPVRAGTVFDSAGHGKVTDTATWGGSSCSDCHDEYDALHINGSLGDNRLSTVNGNDYGTSINEFCATSCHSTVVNAHYDNGWTSGGSSDDGNRCDLCHDPHGQSGHDAMIAATIAGRAVTAFADKAVRSSYFVADTSSGFGVCQVCHDPAEVSHFNRGLEEDATHFTGRVCIDCHLHTTAVAFEASCTGCHAEAGSLPLAHNKHAQTQTTGGVQISCEICHGVGAETASHQGHAAGGETVQAANITLLGQSSYVASYGARPSWFDSTWYAATFGATSVSYSGTSDFTCNSVRCHGGESVVWNQSADSGANTYSDVCFNCHNITPASFQLPGDTLRQAGNAAANYVGPISEWGRGGHGDSRINDPAWFEEVAPGWTVPLGCTACHDETQDHFPVASGNRFRVSDAAVNNTLPGADASQTRITNLCVSCHSEQTGDFHFLAPPKHPSDNYDTDWTGGVSRSQTFVTESGMSVFSTFDPVTAGVGSHIDQYVDHWEYWGGTGASSTAGDDQRFLPMGDSLDPAQNFNNDTGDLVTCITCHNPHGTDLYVTGEQPNVADTTSQIPANRMLRLREQDDELCAACHR
jgi:predicted CxxxxCH...CXXCH cytochrome family protein